jgi:hypothetical protein
MDYRPDTREVVVHCRVGRSWIAGRLVLPVQRNLLDYLNAAQTFLKLVDAVLPSGPRQAAGFVALRRDAISLILPDEGETGITQDQGAGQFTQQPVACLFETGEVSGLMSVRKNIRVSDELGNAKGFFAVRKASLRLQSESSSSTLREPVSLLLVNAKHVIGVAELKSS